MLDKIPIIFPYTIDIFFASISRLGKKVGWIPIMDPRFPHVRQKSHPPMTIKQPPKSMVPMEGGNSYNKKPGGFDERGCFSYFLWGMGLLLIFTDNMMC